MNMWHKGEVNMWLMSTYLGHCIAPRKKKLLYTKLHSTSLFFLHISLIIYLNEYFFYSHTSDTNSIVITSPEKKTNSIFLSISFKKCEHDYNFQKKKNKSNKKIYSGKYKRITGEQRKKSRCKRIIRKKILSMSASHWQIDAEGDRTPCTTFR